MSGEQKRFALRVWERCEPFTLARRIVEYSYNQWKEWDAHKEDDGKKKVPNDGITCRLDPVEQRREQGKVMDRARDADVSRAQVCFFYINFLNFTQANITPSTMTAMDGHPLNRGF